MKIIAVLFDLYGTLAGFEPSRFSLQSKVAKKYGYELTEKGVAQGYFLADKFMAEQNVTYPIRSQSELEKKNFFAKYEKLVLSGDGHDVDVETFRDQLPIVKNDLKGKEKETILLYCTGGIRCE